MSEISSLTKELIERYQSWYNSSTSKEGVSTIHVDEVASKVAKFYEKIKGVVDWREEHLLRKRAIERSLKRRIFLEENNTKKIAESLVYELIRGGHFPNDKIPETKIEDIQFILDKFFFIISNFSPKKQKEFFIVRNWLLEVISYEIEKNLSPADREEALIDFMTEIMKKRIKIQEGAIKVGSLFSEEKKDIQIYIAVQKALFKFDDATISYYLLEKMYPQWRLDNLKKQELDFSLSSLAKEISLIKEKIDRTIHHPISEKFFNICEKYNTPYLLLGDIISDNPLKAEENFSNPEKLEFLIKKFYEKRLKRLKGRITRSAIYSTFSVFITKIAVALAIEVPLDKYLVGSFNKFALLINTIFPPLLMFGLVSTVKTPDKKNLQRVIVEAMKICYQTEREDIYEIRIPKKRNKIFEVIISIFYAVAFLFSFGLIIKGLQKLHFSIFSMIIFVFFISVISFLGVKIREQSKELTVEEKKEGFIRTIIDFFTMPIVLAGKWFSERWSKMNIALIIAILIDMPFLTFVEFLEQWRSFIKEQKEKIH